MRPPFEGGCLCGAVRFRAQPPSLFCVHCHCEWCRRAHGAAFVTWLGVSDERFELTAGSELRWYASSEQSERGFCGRCGTMMLYRSKVAPGETHIARGCIIGTVDRAPRAHMFYDAHVSWIDSSDELPKHHRDAPCVAAFASIPPKPE